MSADEEANVDPVARRQLAEAIRHFASGQISNVEFDHRIPVTDEQAVYEIEHLSIWPLYDDFRTHRLTGNNTLTKANRKSVARIILFLRSGQPYRFPVQTRRHLPVFWPIAPLVIGWASGSLSLGVFLFLVILLTSTCYAGAYYKGGRGEFWPFRTKSDYEFALANPVYLRGAQEQ